MAYKYRDAGVYEVARGQVWSVGSHVFVCGDVVEDQTLSTLLSQDPPDLLFADPPWSDGQQQQFRTLNDLPPSAYPWQRIFEQVLVLAPRVPNWIVGDRYTVDVLEEMLRGRGARCYQRWLLPAFSTPRVIGVLHYAFGMPPPPGPTFQGVKDQKLPGKIIERYHPKGLVCDPCSGLGITSRCAEQLGWRSVNNELSPHRVSAALRRMEKLTGERPERVN